MIIVFAELGGERLLGRAREIADALGLRVLAVSSKDSEKQKLISLGADEVISFDASTVSEWSRVLSYLLRNEKQTRFLLIPSNYLGNAILGSTYALASERIGSFADSVENFSEQSASKIIHPSNVIFQVSSSQDKVSLWSIKLNSVPEPIEDTSRYGTTRNLELPKEQQKAESPTIDSSETDSSSKLTMLASENYLGDASRKSMLEGLANRYSASLLEMKSTVQIIYGPCLAIEVDSKERELPEFQSELISLNSKSETPISRISKLSATTPNMEKVIELLKSS